ncbi:MAG TPA: cytochrome c oxidase subunit II [Gaiellaceae bacterium]|nr:cytochrome c oxidase subunit II [Gaiellaceae bacterium]
MRRGGLIQLVLIGLVAGAIATSIAIFVPWLPTPASREAGRINFVYWFTIIICLFIFSVVSAILIYAMINFRAKEGDFSDGPPVHGHTLIEIIWTIIPAVLVTAVAIVSAIVLAKDSHAGKNPLKINVIAEQFAWNFEYPGHHFSPYLYLPVDRGVELRITSNDVIHSFWVPQFAQKQDAVPGQFNNLVITPDRLGTYPVICTELCGLGHSVMRSKAVVLTAAKYQQWYAGLTKPATSAAGGAPGSTASIDATFKMNGCGACHAFKAIPGATGKIGPSLDQLKEDASKAGQPLDAFIEKSITDPDAYIAPGYQPHVMPSNFGQAIPKDQLDALVQYLAQHTN